MTINKIFSKHKKVIDPPRFPKIINSYEGVMKKNYEISLSKTLLDITKFLISK